MSLAVAVAVAVSVDPSHCECVAGGGSADRDNCGGDGSVNSDGCQWLWSSRADESGGSGGSGGGSANRDGCQWLAAVAVASVDLLIEAAAGGCVPVALTSLVAAVVVAQPLHEKLKRAVILSEAVHSDHCPVS